MADRLATEMVAKNLTARGLSFWISFDHKSLDENPHYEGPILFPENPPADPRPPVTVTWNGIHG